MILLKANEELKSVFERMIKAMGVNVLWNGKFVVLNNFLILSGNVRSLIFHFDNRKVNTNVIELPDRDEDARPVGNNEILTNVLNMTLYAFGKWGTIKGIRVDQDYGQLNGLFQAILKDMKITPGFRDDYFRFYRDNIQMTYEEVVEAAIEEGERRANELKQEDGEAEPEKGLGLWRKVLWKAGKCKFAKVGLSEYEKKASRLGNNFYQSAYQCPVCSAKLFMVVYPEGEEFPVETEEGKVYLARCYACDACNSFYTARPRRLLQEGDVYTLDFEDDRDAYEDYLDLLGKSGLRTTNYHFNEYEWQRGKTKQPATIEAACANLETMEEEELLELDGKLEEGFYPLQKAAPYQKRIQELLRRNGSDGKAEHTDRTGSSASGTLANAAMEAETAVKTGKGTEIRSDGGRNADVRYAGGRPEAEAPRAAGNAGAARGAGCEGGAGATGNEIHAGDPKKPGNGTAVGMGAAVNAKSTESGMPGEEKREKYRARMQVLARMSPRQLTELERQIRSDKELSQDEKKEFLHQISEDFMRREEDGIRQKIRDCEGKPYSVLSRLESEVGKAKITGAARQELTEQLGRMKRARGEQEVKQLMDSMPANMTRGQYQAFCRKLSQYADVDLSRYEAQLEERGKQANQAELAAMQRRIAGGSRKGLMDMLGQLKEGFSQQEAEPLRKQITERIQRMDEAAIDKICPNITRMTFDEAAEAYEKIEGGPFLPELKTNTLGMLDKRLTKIKMDECALLVEKLQGEINGRIRDTERLHFYEARRALMGDWEPEEAKPVAKAMNTYAADRSRYEYPILVCDSSAKKNGKEGFLLTPDHIFYNSAFNSEKIAVRAIHGIEGNTGLLNRGILIRRANGDKTKIPGGIPAKELDVFGRILDEFVSYLQEKPESRNITYLAKEEHEVICCYRCGYIYRNGTVCPKCGNQANR